MVLEKLSIVLELTLRLYQFIFMSLILQEKR